MSRPVNRYPKSYRSTSRQGGLSSISWWWSLILPLALLLLAGTVIYDLVDDDNPATVPGVPSGSFVVTVTDAGSGQPVQGAQVEMSGVGGATDSNGSIAMPIPSEPSMITVSSPGYQPVYGTVDPDVAAMQSVALQPGDEASIGSMDTTGADSETNPSDQVAAGSIAGTVVDESGAPISGAVVVVSQVVAHSDDAGAFVMDGITSGDQIHLWASGYADLFSSATDGTEQTFTLTRQDIKALYLSGANLGNQEVIDGLIDTIDTTEANALVVDIKEGQVYYDTNVQFFRDAGVVAPAFDPAQLVATLHEHGVYAIARLVVFNDPLVAEAYPDLAIQDANGGLWLGSNDNPWVNPFLRQLWTPNIDLAVEAANLGFDEIQYDYVRFPSDGDLSTADFGADNDYSAEGRVQTIEDFLRLSKQALEPLGAKLGADIFGIIAVYPENEQGIGQSMEFVRYVDYICPMIYPSHFEVGSIGVPGTPNDYPSETVDIAVGLGMQAIPGFELKMRPWLQDFTMGDTVYGPEQVRAQIDKTMELGASGWMLWNANSEVTVDALDPA